MSDVTDATKLAALLRVAKPGDRDGWYERYAATIIAYPDCADAAEYLRILAWRDREMAVAVAAERMAIATEADNFAQQPWEYGHTAGMALKDFAKDLRDEARMSDALATMLAEAQTETLCLVARAAFGDDFPWIDGQPVTKTADQIGAHAAQLVAEAQGKALEGAEPYSQHRYRCDSVGTNDPCSCGYDQVFGALKSAIPAPALTDAIAALETLRQEMSDAARDDGPHGRIGYEVLGVERALDRLRGIKSGAEVSQTEGVRA